MAAFDAEAWKKGFCELEDSEDGHYILDEVSNLPADLVGTYFRNGPGKFGINGMSISHPLDGDGLAVAISFYGDGKVAVRHRFVQTQGYLRDQQENRIVAPGIYGTEPQGGDLFDIRKLELKNTSNAAMLWWEERLLSLSPFGKPFEIDPISLGTLIGNQDSGATNIGNLLNQESPFGSVPRVCATTGHLVNISQVATGSETRVQFHEIKPNNKWKGRYMLPVTAKVASYTDIADFAVTPTWFAIAKPPLKVDGFAATFGKRMPEVLSYDPSGDAELIFATRDRAAGREVVVPVDGLVCKEFANAYELEGFNMVLDMVVADRWDVGRPSGEQPLWETEDPASQPRTKLVRYEVDLVKKTYTKRDLCDRHLGFATVNPKVVGKPHRYVFCAISHDAAGGAGPMAGVAKVDTQSGQVDAWVPEPTEFGGEPVFVPRSEGGDEDDGYLIMLIFDGAAQRSDVAVFDARDVAKGPICRFPLKVALPHGLRGTWAPGLTPSEEEFKRKYVLLRMFKKKANKWNASSSDLAIFRTDMIFEKMGGKMR